MTWRGRLVGLVYVIYLGLSRSLEDFCSNNAWLQILHPSLVSSPSYSYLCRTKKADVARVEKRTFICSPTRSGAKPTPKDGVKSKLGHWMQPDEMDAQLDKDFISCMKGKNNNLN